MSLSAEYTVTVLFSINILDLQNQFSFYEYCELEIRSWYYKKNKWNVVDCFKGYITKEDCIFLWQAKHSNIGVLFFHTLVLLMLWMNVSVSEQQTKYGIMKKHRTSFLSIDDQLHLFEKCWCT